MNVRDLWNWRVVLIFAVVGPLVGGFYFSLLLWAYVPGAGGLLDSSGSTPIGLAMLGGGSYVAGLLPAVATGILASFLWAWRPLRTKWWVRTSIGAALGYGVMLLVQYVYLDQSDLLVDAFVFASLGGAGGAAAGLIAGRWVAPNNSFKPTPLRGAA